MAAVKFGFSMIVSQIDTFDNFYYDFPTFQAGTIGSKAVEKYPIVLSNVRAYYTSDIMTMPYQSTFMLISGRSGIFLASFPKDRDVNSAGKGKGRLVAPLRRICFNLHKKKEGKFSMKESNIIVNIKSY